MLAQITHVSWLTPEERLFSGIKVAPSGCWEWQRHRDPAGYGTISVNRRRYRAHRLAYEFRVGSIPDGVQVLHRCDNPPCCNPDHLFLGTALDNMMDMTAKGRRATTPTGDAHWRTKLPDEVVRQLRARAATGERLPVYRLANELGVAASTLYRVLKRRARLGPAAQDVT